jgi:hypothetical protein
LGLLNDDYRRVIALAEYLEKTVSDLDTPSA